MRKGTKGARTSSQARRTHVALLRPHRFGLLRVKTNDKEKSFLGERYFFRIPEGWARGGESGEWKTTFAPIGCQCLINA